MSNTFQSIVYKNLGCLLETWGFTKSDENCKSNYYDVTYCSGEICIMLQKYRRELYSYVYKLTFPNDRVNLYTLLEYLDRHKDSNIKSNYFINEKDLNECYRLQAEWVATFLKEKIEEILDFFSEKQYNQNIDALRYYVTNKYPEMFVKW